MDAFGWRGIIILGLLTGSVLLFGAFSVWFYTGVKTSSLVLCLVQLEQQEISAQLGNLVHEVAIQAAAIANLTLGSAALLPSPDASGFAISGSQFLPGGSVTPDSLLMHAVDAVQAMASGQASPFAVFIASLAAAHPGFRLHVAVGDGTYFGVTFNSSASVLVHGRPSGGCLMQSVMQLANIPVETNEATYASLSEVRSLGCDWSPTDQVWYGVDSCTQDGFCWSPPFRTADGAAIALRRPIGALYGNAPYGVFAVEAAFAPVEKYMRSFVSNLPAADTQVALVDADDRVLAASTPLQNMEYAMPLGGIDEWSDAVVVLERAHQGLENPGCALSIQTDSISESGSYCDRFFLGVPRCTQVGPVGVDGDCILASDCGLESVLNSSAAGVLLPSGWKLRLQAPQTSYYPKLTTATYGTLIASVFSSIFVAVMLTRVVWLYDRSSDKMKSKGRIKLFGLKVRASTAHTLLLFIGFGMFIMVYLIWYFLFREASHNTRDSIFQVLDEGLIHHVSETLQVLPRAAQIMAAWQPLWSASVDETGATGNNNFSLFATQVMEAQSASRGQPGVVLSGPPATRLVLDEPLALVMHVPVNGSVAGVRRLAEKSYTECTGATCSLDPRLMPWWSATSTPSWSEVHLLGDQLAVTYTLPLASPRNTSGTLLGWIACSLPLHALDNAFSDIGTGSIEISGYIVQALPSLSTGSHQGALIASRAGDEERRLEVGGQWFTGRREPSQSHDKRNRDAAHAVDRFLHGDSLPPAEKIGLPAAQGRAIGTVAELDAKRVYRTFGAPRTFVTPIQGSGCSTGNATATDCGLSLAAVILVDWMDFFAEWYKERDMSLMVFAILLALQLHVVQVLIHSSIRHVEGARGQRNHLDEIDPTHETATEELAEAISARRSTASTNSTATVVSNNNATFERYRVIIAEEVRRAQSVKWQRFLMLQVLQQHIAGLLTYLPLERFPKLERTQRELSRPWRGEEGEQEKRHRRAIRYVQMAQDHRNILTVCTLRQGRKFASLQCYLLQSTSLYMTFIQAVVFIHVALVILEPTPETLDSGRESGECPVTPGHSVALGSLLCILIELADTAGCRWVARNERAVAASSGRRRRQSFRNLGRFDGDNMLQSRGEATRREVRTFLLGCIMIEWVLLYALCRRPFNLYLPLRPIYLVLCSRSLSATCSSVLQTLKTRGMRSVAVCFITLWILAAMFATTLLRSQGNGIVQPGGDFSCAAPGSPPSTPAAPSAGEEAVYQDTKLNDISFTPVSFQTFTLSLISTFILISTGENYADVISRPFFCYDPTSDGDVPPPRTAFILLYWIVLSVIGLVLIIGMFIGVFQDGFVRQRRAQQTQMKLFERVGAIAAFSLLDVEQDGHVSASEFVAFIKYLEKNEGMAFVMTPAELFDLLQEYGGTHEKGETRMNLTSFVLNLWFLQLRGVTSVKLETSAANRLPTLRALYDHPTLVIQKFVKFMLIVHALIACLYGFLLEDSSELMDTMLALLVIVEALEVVLKFVVYGPRLFWNAGQYEVGKTFEQWENRTALIISGGSLFAWLCTRGSPAARGFGFGYRDDLQRLILVAPTLRLFFALKQARRVPFVLIPLRAYLGSVFALMVLNGIVWATLGVSFFEDELPQIRDEVDTSSVRVSAFQSVGSASFALLQILIGEGWHDIMFAVMNAKHSWYGAAYFIMFVLIQTILLTNLLVGVVLDSTSGFSIDEELSLQRNVLYGDKLKELEELIEIGIGQQGALPQGGAEEISEVNKVLTPAEILAGSGGVARRASDVPEMSLSRPANQRRTSLVPAPVKPPAPFKPQLLPCLSRCDAHRPSTSFVTQGL